MLRKLLNKLVESKRFSQFIILISFLISFIGIRIIAFLQKLDLIPDQDKALLHIHHLVPGILLLIVSGYLGISFWATHRIRIVMAILFGMGAALTIDEFALWLYLKDVYWEYEGRASVDAVIITVLIFSIAVLISEIHDHKWIKKLMGKF